MRIRALLHALLALAACGAWPEVEGSPAASRGVWPTLLPISDVYPVETDAADPEGAADALASRADLLRERAAILRADVNSQDDFEALRARIGR